MSMYSTQAVNDIHNYLLKNYGINLAFSICDSMILNKAVTGYRKGQLTLEDAAIQAKGSITEVVKG